MTTMQISTYISRCDRCGHEQAATTAGLPLQWSRVKAAGWASVKPQPPAHHGDNLDLCPTCTLRVAVWWEEGRPGHDRVEELVERVMLEILHDAPCRSSGGVDRNHDPQEDALMPPEAHVADCVGRLTVGAMREGLRRVLAG